MPLLLALVLVLGLAGACSDRPPASPPPPPPAAERWPFRPTSPYTGWPKTSFDMLRYLGQSKSELMGVPGYVAPVASRGIVEDGVTFTYIADANHNVYFVRAHLSGAATRPAEARAWLGLPPVGDPPPRGDLHFTVAVEGDEVTVLAWSLEGETRSAGWRERRGAAAHLADELIVTNPTLDGWFHAGWIEVDGAEVPVMDFYCLHCSVDAPVILAEWQAEDRNSPRRTALRKLGFRKFRVAWTQVFGEIEI